MDTLPNELLIKILDYLDTESYINFLNTGYRGTELIDPIQYDCKKQIYLISQKKSKIKQSFREIIDNRELDIFEQMGVNINKLDTTMLNANITDILGEQIYDIIDDESLTNSERLTNAMKRIMSAPEYKTEEFQNSMRDFGRSILDNGGMGLLLNGMGNGGNYFNLFDNLVEVVDPEVNNNQMNVYNPIEVVDPEVVIPEVNNIEVNNIEVNNEENNDDVDPEYIRNLSNYLGNIIDNQ